MGACIAGLRREFALSNFNLEHEKPELFVTSQWAPNNKFWRHFYVFWRVFFAIFWVVILLISGIRIYAVNDMDNTDFSPHCFFIYMSNHALMILTVDCIVQAATAIKCSLRYNKLLDYTCIIPNMTWYLKMQWVLTNISLSTGIIITIGFIAYVIPDTEKQENEPTVTHPYLYVHTIKHFVNTMYLLANLLISGLPLRIYHVYHSLIPAIAYLFFTWIYYTLGGTDAWGGPYIYSMLDWRKPEEATLNSFFIGVLWVLLIWLLMYGLYRAKVGVYDLQKRWMDYNQHRRNIRRRLKATRMNQSFHSNQLIGNYPYYSAQSYITAPQVPVQSYSTLSQVPVQSYNIPSQVPIRSYITPSQVPTITPYVQFQTPTYFPYSY